MAKMLLMQPKNNSMEITMSKTVPENLSRPNAYIITGPTSGIGRATALELAKHGTGVLVGPSAASWWQYAGAITRIR
jgi:hypothetical protein